LKKNIARKHVFYAASNLFALSEASSSHERILGDQIKKVVFILFYQIRRLP
jgi:hypothetical protein